MNKEQKALLKELQSKTFKTSDEVGRKARAVCVDSDEPGRPFVFMVVGDAGHELPRTYSADLKYWGKSGHAMDLIEVLPYEGYKLDDEVVCWSDEDPKDKVIRRFKEVVGSKAVVFDDGYTSGMTDYASPWDNCVLLSEYKGEQNV